MLFKIASAHEAYVLPDGSFWEGIKEPLNAHVFSALQNPNNLKVAIIIAVSVWLLLGLNFFFRRSQIGQKTHMFFERFAKFGPHFVRIAIAAALFFSATSNSFLGPELHAGLLPYAQFTRIILLCISLMIAVGIFTELAALLGIVIYIIGLFVYGPYIFTYFNYLGELIVLLLFGLRSFSADGYLFGPLKRFRSLAKYETVIIRAFYGLALIYAAITVKLLHPELTVSVVNIWHLNQYHWLFPSDPLLITLGAGIVEIVIGLFILVGFQMRLTILISLFYITLSLLFFRELVWPHFLLYGISLSLLVQPEIFAIDNLLFRRKLNNPSPAQAD